jgi:hypothetical protein
MATAVEAAIAEIDAALVVFAPQHEGLRDFARLNLQPETLTQVNALITKFDQRVAALTAARVGLITLMDHGHPTLPVSEVTALVLADLQAQMTTIEAALPLFHEQPVLAGALNLGAGAPVPKSS